MTRSTRILFSFALATLAAPAQIAGPALSNSLTALHAEHRLSSLGTDDIQRGVRFAGRIYRQDNCIWIAHELPPASVHVEYDHADPCVGHKHANTDTAPHWIERNIRGTLTAHVMSASQQKNYAVEPVEYSSIDFDGSWTTTYHLLDSTAFRGMRAEDPVRNGMQTYRPTQGEHTVTADWDVAGQYLRRMESRDTIGTQRKLTRMTVLPAPITAPWECVQRYAAADHTDLMN